MMKRTKLLHVKYEYGQSACFYVTLSNKMIVGVTYRSQVSFLSTMGGNMTQGSYVWQR